MGIIFGATRFCKIKSSSWTALIVCLWWDLCIVIVLIVTTSVSGRLNTFDFNDQGAPPLRPRRSLKSLSVFFGSITVTMNPIQRLLKNPVLWVTDTPVADPRIWGTRLYPCRWGASWSPRLFLSFFPGIGLPGRSSGEWPECTGSCGDGANNRNTGFA